MDKNSELLLGHFKNPRNTTPLQNPTHTATAKNSTCNDTVHYDLTISKNKIAAVHFHGTGCALSQGCASLLSELIIGKTINDIKTYIASPEKLHKVFSKSSFPSRLNCARLGFSALEDIISSKHRLHPSPSQPTES